MATQNFQLKLPQDDSLDTEVLSNQASADLSNPVASDGYDPHMIPAETATRKDRESKNFKQLPDQPDDSEAIDVTGGFTVDQEGLVNNFAIEPEMYYETPGDAA